MKNKILFPFILLLLWTGNIFAGQYVVTNIGTTFSPANITINPGDTVVFSLALIHNAVEVSQSTYNANGSTSNGGFSLPLGGGSVVFATSGIFYYVCVPHASMGMKGTITVLGGAGINHVSATPSSVKCYPNPFINGFNISLPADIYAGKIEIIDMAGRTLFERIILPGIESEWIETTALKPGTYFLKMEAEGKFYSEKLVKQSE
jgi:plastocyanin